MSYFFYRSLKESFPLFVALATAATLIGCDTDKDGIEDQFDNCPSVANPLQEDIDTDGTGDACEHNIWSTFHGKANRTGWNTTETAAPSTLNLQWISLRGVPNVADSNLIIESSPVMDEQRVYVATLFDVNFESDYNSSIVAIDRATGAVAWHTPLGTQGIWATPTISGTLLFVAAWDGYVYALNTSDGSILWQTQLFQGHRPFRASPVIHRGNVIVGTECGGSGCGLYMLNALTGAIVSTYVLPGSLYSSPVLIYPDRLAVAVNTPDGNSKMLAFNVTTTSFGTPLWTKNLVGGSWATPTAYRNLLIHRAGSLTGDGLLYIINPVSGTDIVAPLNPTWPLINSFSAPSVANNTIILTSDTLVYALDLNQILANVPVNPLWTFDPPGSDDGYIFSSPAIGNGLVYFGTDDNSGQDGAFYAVNLATGAMTWSYNRGGLGTGSAQASPALSKGDVVFAGYDANNHMDSGVYFFSH